MVAATAAPADVRPPKKPWRRSFLLRPAVLPGVVVAVAAATFSAACAGRTAPAAPGPLTEPRASWLIRAGDYGSEREICRSDGNPSCVLPASSDAEPVSVTVAIYLYPTDAATTYQGAFLSGFVGSGGHELKVDYKADPGERPTAVSVTGMVTKRPGEYPFRMALYADVAGHTDPHQFQQMFNVRVVPPASTTE